MLEFSSTVLPAPSPYGGPNLLNESFCKKYESFVPSLQLSVACQLLTGDTVRMLSRGCCWGADEVSSLSKTMTCASSSCSYVLFKNVSTSCSPDTVCVQHTHTHTQSTNWQPAADPALGKRGFVGESGDGSPPLGSRGKAPVADLGDKSSRSWWYSANDTTMMWSGRKQNSICQLSIIAGSFMQRWEVCGGGEVRRGCSLSEPNVPPGSATGNVLVTFLILLSYY